MRNDEDKVATYGNARLLYRHKHTFVKYDGIYDRIYIYIYT